MAKGSSLGKTVVLLFLLIILVLGGLLWFDFLGVIRVKNLFAPVYKLFGLSPQTSATSTSSKPLSADLDLDRLAKQREALDIYREELEKREGDSSLAEDQNRRLAEEIAEREKKSRRTRKNIQQSRKNVR